MPKKPIRVTETELISILRGEPILRGLFRRVISLDDGPFELRADEQPDYGKDSIGDVPLKPAKPDFDSKKGRFGKGHHNPLASIELVPFLKNYPELRRVLPEWPYPANDKLKAMLQKKQLKREKEETAVGDKLNEMWNRSGSYLDIPVPPIQLVQLGNQGIEELMREFALTQIEPVEAESFRDESVLGEFYIGRNIENEIVAVLGLTNRSTRYSEGIADAVRISENKYEEEMSALAGSVRDAKFIEVKWLLIKDHTKGYATQMMVKAFRHAGYKDAGLILTFPPRAYDFFRRFYPIMLENRIAAWTPAKVEAMAAETKAGLPGSDGGDEDDKYTWDIESLKLDGDKGTDEGAPATGTASEERTLTQREDLSEIMIGGKVEEELADHEIEGGVYTEPMDWKLLPRNWAKKITIEEGREYISDEDQAVLDQRDPVKQGQLDNFYTPFTGRHGDHKDQEGRPPEQGGSEPGYTHDGGGEGTNGDGNGAETEGMKRIREEASGYAREIYARAVEDEPELTTMMGGLAEKYGGKLKGLKHSIKSEESTLRKVMLGVEQKGLTVEQAKEDMAYDVNRYTIALSKETLVNDAFQMQDDLAQSGWTQYDHKWTNYYRSGDGYDGYNMVVEHKETGRRMELQLHTPESYKIKSETHVYYSEFRETTTSEERRADLWPLITAPWGNYPKPDGWEKLPGVLKSMDRPIGGTRYFARIRDNPNAENYKERMSLHRFEFSEGGLKTEWWDRRENKWVDDPELITFTGIGGANDYEEITLRQAHELYRDLQKKPLPEEPEEETEADLEKRSLLGNVRSSLDKLMSEIFKVQDKPPAVERTEESPVLLKILGTISDTLEVIKNKGSEQPSIHVEVPPATITVEAPPPAEVTVNVEAPEVKPEIKVEVPSQPVEVSVQMPDMVETNVVERDEKGFIKTIRRLFRSSDK